MTTNHQAGLPRTVAVINGKGGTFKTSVVASLGGLAAAAGWRVLVVDFDPQANLTEDLGLASATDEGAHQLHVIPTGQNLQPAPAGRDRLEIVYGGHQLHDLHAVMQSRQSRDPEGWRYSLANALGEISEDYDLIVIHCPPGNEVLQTLALVAARYALIPTRSDASSRKGLREVARRFGSVRPYNPDLELLGVVRTGITSSAGRIREQVKREIETDLGGVAPVLDTCIRYAEAAAKTARDSGRLPHELEPELEEQRSSVFRRLQEAREARKAEKGDKAGRHRAGESIEPMLPQSTTGLAQDYTAMAQEVFDLIAAAEAAADTGGDAPEDSADNVVPLTQKASAS